MEQLLKNANEFLASATENLTKKRYNAAVSDFFKSIVIFSDYLIYQEIKRFPKNHNDRFHLLKIHFEEIYNKVSPLFKSYIKSYNLNMQEIDAIKMESYANELKNFITNKN
ncbi:MAG: HEPN domain-containing protein [Nanoarchaeota archaeon]|nr:HEPN domain-containing protein [Nanoarchaeota archaeon]